MTKNEKITSMKDLEKYTFIDKNTKVCIACYCLLYRDKLTGYVKYHFYVIDIENEDDIVLLQEYEYIKGKPVFGKMRDDLANHDLSITKDKIEELNNIQCYILCDEYSVRGVKCRDDEKVSIWFTKSVEDG